MSQFSPGKWTAFGGATLPFFFLNAATFTSLGVVLFTMSTDLHWSMTSAGLSFTLLGLACGLSSPLAAIAMIRLGGRGALAAGSALLAAGFLIASISQTLWLFYVAMTLLGVGYTLAGNVPGVYLIAGWFRTGSARVIGYYYMLGALGAGFGPPVVEFIVRSAGWHAHWRIMACLAAFIAACCLLIVREPAHAPDLQDESASQMTRWSVRQALLTPQFFVVAAAMTATMACLTTNSSILVGHLARLGTPPAAGAFVLSAAAFSATFVKGIAGRLCEHVAPSLLLAAGLVLQAAGCLLLADATGPVRQYAAALSTGAGWGLTFVCGTILPLSFFGHVLGSKILSAVALLTTCAAAGPLAAGMIADRTGSFAPIYTIYAGGLVVLAFTTLLVRQPRLVGWVA